jgi:hypothetical protein
VCDLIKQSLPSINLLSCTQTGITAQLNGRTYRRTLVNSDIIDYKVSNSGLQSTLKAVFQDPTTSRETLASTIKEMVLYNPLVQASGADLLALEKAKVFQDIQTALGVQPSDVLKITNQYLVQFTLQGVSFIALYNPETKTLSRFYFVQKTKTGNRISINKFQLSLLLTGQESINAFLTDPLEAIKKIDPLARAEYTQ